MARVSNVLITGTMGNIVMYHRMGKNCARLKREGIKQTMATKIRSENFGIASRTAKTLRVVLAPAIPVLTDRSMQNRFPGAIARWLRLSSLDNLTASAVVPNISGFQFTNGESLRERFKVPITVSQSENNLITVSVDAFVPVKRVFAPANTMMLELVIAVAGCSIKTGRPTGSVVRRIQVPYNKEMIPSQLLQFPISLPGGSLAVTAAWLQYFVRTNNGITRSDDPAYLPAGIINARYS